MAPAISPKDTLSVGDESGHAPVVELPRSGSGDARDSDRLRSIPFPSAPLASLLLVFFAPIILTDRVGPTIRFSERRLEGWVWWQARRQPSHPSRIHYYSLCLRIILLPPSPNHSHSSYRLLSRKDCCSKHRRPTARTAP